MDGWIEKKQKTMTTGQIINNKLLTDRETVMINRKTMVQIKRERMGVYMYTGVRVMVGRFLGIQARVQLWLTGPGKSFFTPLSTICDFLPLR